jgi:cell division protein FtsI/penicillin-binding protein 2
MDDAWDSWESGRYDTSSWRLALWTDGCKDGMTRRPNGWQGTEFSYLQTLHNLLEALLNNGILVKKHLYKEVIFSNRMLPITNYQTPHLAILGQKSLDRFKNTIPVQIKNYSIFLSQKGQRIKQSNKKETHQKLLPLKVSEGPG